MPAPLRRALLAAATLGPSRVRRRPVDTLAAAGPAERLLAMSGALAPALRRELVRGPLAELDGNAALRAISYRLGDLPDAPLPAALYLDGQLGLADDMLHYFDRASMAHSLEVRVPFLDHQLVELCASMPADLKVRRLETKHVLRHAARGLVPDRIIDKPKIGFFNSAVDDWFRAQTRGAISDYLLGPNPRYAEMIDRDAGRTARQGTRRRERRRQRLRAALDSDARGLALGVPAARALDRDRAQRERIVV